MQSIYLTIPLAPLLGSLVAGLFCRVIPRWVAHTATISGVAVAFICSLIVFQDVSAGNVFNGNIYTWLTSGTYIFKVGFLIDSLTALMMLVVTFVSLMVHIYTVGYMSDDPGYNRFFSYISLFTFSMLVLVMSNNFMQLFFGWEAVGLVSYLLIGFWYTRPTAIFANMKAFLVNRVGDFGFILGIGLVLAYFGTLDYADVFAQRGNFVGETVPILGFIEPSLVTTICICLFIGAMGKSAQIPLHVWLPDSMEGPTPISALIHAATMVTAGIFMVSRMSPLFEMSSAALSFVMIIGALTALLMGFLGIVQDDIKRVVAYSTLSQLGYMTVALGASAYSVAIFHLMTHAFFKALLFLAAGSVIIGMHHDQNIKNMGGLWRYMPVTWMTFLIGTLALVGTPFFSGFYSKDSIIEVLSFSDLPGAEFAYICVLSGVFVTAFYSFRLYFLVFHGGERFMATQANDGHEHSQHDATHNDHSGKKPHETHWVVTLPLVLLAIPSIFIGFMTIDPILFSGYFGDAIFVDHDTHHAIENLQHHFHGAIPMGLHAFGSLPFALALSGALVAWLFYIKWPGIPLFIRNHFSAIDSLLANKYYFDKINEIVFARWSCLLGKHLWLQGDVKIIDGLIVNGFAKLIERLSILVRHFQTGYVYHYAFAMVLGVFMLLTFWIS